MAKKNVKKASLGWFFWVAFILLIALLFFINKNNIKNVLEKTKAKNVFEKNKNEEIEKEPDIETIQSEIEKITAELENAFEDENTSNTEQKDKPGKNKEKEIFSVKDKTETENKNKIEDKEENKPTQEENSIKKTEPAKEQKKSFSVFFVKVESDGRITRKSVNRELIKSDSPMSDVLNNLLKGPTKEEQKKGLRSFIPPETRLLSAYVKNGMAIINVSEDFQFNQYGIEAYYAQLAQIVFTACEFPTVDSVQFLIEGKKKEYLGGEGVWIGSPLTLNSF